MIHELRLQTLDFYSSHIGEIHLLEKQLDRHKT